MAVLAWGFDGTLTETDWAWLAPQLGVPYAVSEGLDLQVNLTNRTRTIVGVGSGHAYGVRYQLTAEEVRDLVPPTSGSRWDMVALRINWQTNKGEVVVVQGGSSRALPAGRQRSPGTLFDVPLVLARLQAGEARIMEWVDLRLGASKMISGRSSLALPPGVFGGRARIQDLEYESDGLNWSIVPEVPPVELKDGQVIRAWQSGWGYGGAGLYGSSAIVTDLPGGAKQVDLFVQTRKYSPAFLFDQYGGTGDIEIGRVVPELEPGRRGANARGTFWGGLHGDSDAFFTNGCDMFLNASGGIIIRGGAPPNHQITRRLTDAPSLEVTFNYTVLP
ncbi:hypothetical protein [Auraticoccus monumenti]|uniref:Uncharacterized protein n=1 Tax=Auraticoccus monumenti TaxID=675864 RepID=A0A1G6UH24_9ACTN|nr:hypothetical protein [Auraticoccus monumenti]SDD40581.1 hypothetical protein SAMN04489747_0883 [Auraticoccus monumenti]